MELYTKNVIFVYGWIIFGLKVLVDEKKRPFLQIFFLLFEINQFEINQKKIEFTKKQFFVIFIFLGEKLILVYVKNTKSQILHAKFFFRKNLYLSTKASLQPKKSLKKFSLKFVLLLMKKCILYNFQT